MSAKNRKTESIKDDKYYTPEWCVKLFVKQALSKYLSFIDNTKIFTNGNWLDPCVGSGNIIKAVNSCYFGIPQWSCVELRSEEYNNLNKLYEDKEINNFYLGNFLNDYIFTQDSKFDIVLSNPPYTYAEEFIFKSLKISKYVIFLLSLNFLGSQKRTWLDSNMPDVYILPKRPQFRSGINPETGKKFGTDACEFAWMVWDSENPKDYSITKRLKMEK